MIILITFSLHSGTPIIFWI